jgi:excisionase family DNA binding protein
MSLAIELPDDVIEAVAQRVAILNAGSQQPTPGQWLTVQQAAEHLALSVSQVYALCSARRSNGFPVTKEGSRSYFRASELDAWRASR